MTEQREQYGSPFKRAVKHEAKLRLAIAGPSGSGKTYTALRLATTLSNGKPIALLDTEHGSASKYADLFAFDVLELEPPYHPDRYVKAIEAATEAGYGVVILDSLTHAWNGEGGLLDVVDQIAKRMKTSNSFAAWKDATPVQNRLIEALLSANVHIIGTMRSKQDYVIEKDDKGRSTVRKLGMAPIQRDGFEYEFDVFLDMDIDNNAIVAKTRCPELTGRVFNKPGEDMANILVEWLGGEPVVMVKKAGSEPKKMAPQQAMEEVLTDSDNGKSATKQARAVVATPRWGEAVEFICEKTNHYMTEGKPNNWHLLAAAAKEGFAEITDDNLKAVIKRLIDRALEKLPAESLLDGLSLETVEEVVY